MSARNPMPGSAIIMYIQYTRSPMRSRLHLGLAPNPGCPDVKSRNWVSNAKFVYGLATKRQKVMVGLPVSTASARPTATSCVNAPPRHADIIYEKVEGEGEEGLLQPPKIFFSTQG